MTNTTAGKIIERKGVVTFKGGSLTLLGPEIKVGSKAPNFEVLGQNLSPVTFADSAGKIRLLSAVPSLDTPVCDLETKRFNEEVGRLPKGAVVITVSMDLPFAQKRWCQAEGVDGVQAVSDHRDGSFGLAYGVLIKELRLLSRAVFVVDPQDRVQYVEYVREITEQPNYDAVFAAIKKLA